MWSDNQDDSSFDLVDAQMFDDYEEWGAQSGVRLRVATIVEPLPAHDAASFDDALALESEHAANDGFPALSFDALDEVAGGWRVSGWLGTIDTDHGLSVSGPMGVAHFDATSGPDGMHVGADVLGYGGHAGYTTNHDGSTTYAVGVDAGRAAVYGGVEGTYTTGQGFGANANVGVGIRGIADVHANGGIGPDGNYTVGVGAGVHTPEASHGVVDANASVDVTYGSANHDVTVTGEANVGVRGGPEVGVEGNYDVTTGAGEIHATTPVGDVPLATSGEPRN